MKCGYLITVADQITPNVEASIVFKEKNFNSQELQGEHILVKK